MAGSTETIVADVFKEYIKQREAGVLRDAIIQAVKPKADLLTRDQRMELARMIQAWEARHGQIGTSTQIVQRVSEPVTAEPRVTAPATEAIPESSAKNFVIRAIDPAAARDPSQRQPCPNCGRMNSKKDAHCFYCGHLLQPEPTAKRNVTKELSDPLDAKTRWGSAYFGESSVLLLAVQGAAKPLEIDPAKEMIIGRADPDSMAHPEIDLTPYQAAELGVSRLHASISRGAETISISDLDSKNGTYINRQCLFPHEVRALRDGDELMLGRLVIKVGFKHVAHWTD
ncbi:MAG: FHA domain-containing protein [Anaerolineae bacterium]|nr:FHA domain-containing protein [Anaerolineae bacterium]